MLIEKSTQKGEHISNSFEKRLRRAESLVLDYLYRFACEEELVTNLKDEVDRIADTYKSRCGPECVCLNEVDKKKTAFENPIYATISEPVRLGAF